MVKPTKGKFSRQERVALASHLEIQCPKQTRQETATAIPSNNKNGEKLVQLFLKLPNRGEKDERVAPRERQDTKREEVKW